MTCYYTYYREDDKREVKRTVAREVSDLKADLTKDLSEIASQIFERLDVIEQAVADPDSEAAASLRKKHGLGKQGPVTPLKGIGKKS